MIVEADFSTVHIKPKTLARFASNKHRKGEKQVLKAVQRVANHASMQAWLRAL